MVALIADLEGVETYQITGQDQYWEIHGSDKLALQYGAAHFLEEMGFRFPHPDHSIVPESLEAPENDADMIGELFQPQMTRRGIHLHTLHPIEGYFRFWEPNDENVMGAKRVIDWLVKNKGNYLQWVALNDIIRSEGIEEAWVEHNQDILNHAKLRGIETGIGVQLYGSANLQQAYDLINSSVIDPLQQITTGVERILQGGEFDVIELSFGEFFGEDADAFIQQINETYGAVKNISPNIEMATRIHVGDDLRVTYNGQEMIYYFLAAYADEEIVPWVHTVMFYTLFESAGGAYHHSEFDQHRDFLLTRLAQGKPTAYFPESAYWVAFDVSVPQYLPIYVRNRWLDIDQLAEAGSPLEEHVLFSSGWEWGYWQNDVATLKLNWKREGNYQTVLADIFGYHDDGAEAARIIAAMAELQQTALVEQHLMPFIAGEDAVMQLGFGADIISQPPRPQLTNLLSMTAIDIDTRYVVPLTQYADGLEVLATQMSGLGLGDRWFDEIKDGIEISNIRARYAASILNAVAAEIRGDDPRPDLDALDIMIEAAKAVVNRRHADLHSSHADRLIDDAQNATIYNFGYLKRADELCYWEREKIQLRNRILGESNGAPGCAI